MKIASKQQLEPQAAAVVERALAGLQRCGRHQISTPLLRLAGKDQQAQAPGAEGRIHQQERQRRAEGPVIRGLELPLDDIADHDGIGAAQAGRVSGTSQGRE